MTPSSCVLKITVPILCTSRRWPFHHTALSIDIVREAETITRMVNTEIT